MSLFSILALTTSVMVAWLLWLEHREEVAAPACIPEDDFLSTECKAGHRHPNAPLAIVEDGANGPCSPVRLPRNHIYFMARRSDLRQFRSTAAGTCKGVEPLRDRDALVEHRQDFIHVER
jgi:hypothetical protein